jgi:hypothetical protein
MRIGRNGRAQLRGSIFSLAILALLAVGLVDAPFAAAKQSSGPVVLQPKWTLVALSLGESTATSDRYVAKFDGQRLTLTDQQTGRRTTLVPPNCPSTSSSPLLFGGPWLMVGCDLYNLNSRQWTSFQISSQCPGADGCTVVGVGRYWVKIMSNNYDGPYDFYDFYLQNISTGQFVHDPSSPGGTVFDDSNAPSGSSPLCPPLRYPTGQGPHGVSELGGLSFYGPGPNQYALTHEGPETVNGTNRLRRCHSNLNLVLPNDSYGGAQPMATSDAVIDESQDGFAFHGWALPSLRRFTIRWPRLLSCGEPVVLGALTKRTIYVGVDGRVYAAPIPTARDLAHRDHPRWNPGPQRWCL